MADGGGRHRARRPTRRPHAADGFGTVRLVVAVGIIFLHAFPLSGSYQGWRPGEPYYHFGTLSVAAFMAMSGYFVMKTWERDPHLGRFWVRRMLRIMPGLLVVLVLAALVLGPLLTTLATAEYFAHPLTWSYLIDNALLFPQQYALPGVFTTNPYQSAVNGSLWCLPIEFLGYFMVTVVGLMGVRRRRYLIFLVALPFAVLLLAVTNQVIELPSTLLMLPTAPLLQYLTIYAMGIAAWLYRDRIRLSWWGVALGVVVEVVGYGTPVDDLTRAVTVPYAIMVIGDRLPGALRLPSWLTVSSYGVFLYGFPVEQIVVHFGADSAATVMLLAIPISIVLGLLSWHLVEKHGLRLRTRLTESRERPEERPRRERADADEPTAELVVGNR